MDVKPPKKFDEQLQLIKDKGFLIEPQEEMVCLEFLKQANYYRASAYFLPFRKEDGNFISDVSFKKVKRIYEFDSRMRGILFEAIEDIEIYLRTQLAYYHAHTYGALG